jgi:hypothetical protein
MTDRIELTAGHGMTELANIWPEMALIMGAVIVGLVVVERMRR